VLGTGRRIPSASTVLEFIQARMWQRPFQAQDEDERQRRLDAQDFGESSYWRWVVLGGLLALAAFALLAVNGLPGTGVILVPMGLGMIIFGGLELLVSH
jgi:hypothetical protein